MYQQRGGRFNGVEENLSPSKKEFIKEQAGNGVDSNLSDQKKQFAKD